MIFEHTSERRWSTVHTSRRCPCRGSWEDRYFDARRRDVEAIHESLTLAEEEGTFVLSYTRRAVAYCTVYAFIHIYESRRGRRTYSRTCILFTDAGVGGWGKKNRTPVGRPGFLLAGFSSQYKTSVGRLKAEEYKHKKFGWKLRSSLKQIV